jgi:hypothetical protein
VNAPLMYCLRELHRRRGGGELQSYFTDEAVVCSVPVEHARDIDIPGLLGEITPETIGELLAAQLVGTGIFGAGSGRMRDAACWLSAGALTIAPPCGCSGCGAKSCWKR